MKKLDCAVANKLHKRQFAPGAKLNDTLHLFWEMAKELLYSLMGNRAGSYIVSFEMGNVDFVKDSESELVGNDLKILN